MPNALNDLQWYGESVWLDYIRRSLITGGERRRLLDEDGLRGVTSLAFLEPNASTEAELAAIRGLIRDRLHVATPLGTGPRYLTPPARPTRAAPTPACS